MLELRLLGTGRARYNDQPLPGFPYQIPYLLLCYLALNRQQRYPREQLSSVFWADYPTSASLKHLRNALWRLRHLLGPAGVSLDDYLSTADGFVSFRTSSPYWLDVEVFETTAVRHQKLRGCDLSADQAVSLEEVVGLYAGDLLDGLYEDWCLYDRERLHLLYINSLGKLMAFHEASGSYERGLEYGRLILACDDTREITHRQMMRLYWLLGDRNAALRQYQTCVQVLRETLNVSPMQETELLQQQIASDHAPGNSLWMAGGKAAVSPAGKEQQPGLGEIELTLQHLRAMLEGINGELARISRLVDELQRQEEVRLWAERRARDAA